MAKRWAKLSVERTLLGARRYLGGCAAAAKFLMVYPFLAPDKTNRFAFGLQSLRDELNYRCPLIPAVDVTELFPGIVDADIGVGKIFPWEGSSILPLEVLVLGAIVRLLKPARVFEIGTSLGVTAYNLALNLPDGGELYTLDLPPVRAGEQSVKTAFEVTVSDRKMIFADRSNRRFLGTRLEPRIHQLYGDSAGFDYSPYVATCDIVFVDGSHALPYVKADSENAFRLAKPDGWVIWHDYNDGFFWPDVRKYLVTIADQRKICRVKGTMFAVCQMGGSA